MAKAKQIVCPACGHKNKSPLAKNRCASCGVRVDEWAPPSSRRESQPPYDQGRFSVLWLMIAFVVTSVLTAAIVVGLPMVVGAFDFEGSAGMMISIPVWFCSGLLVGLISPGKTFMEPVVATLLVAMPTVFFLVNSQTVKTMPVFMYVLLAATGVLFALIGSYAGERIQMGPPPPAKE